MIVEIGNINDAQNILILENQAFKFDRLSLNAITKHLRGRPTSKLLVARGDDPELSCIGFILLLFKARSPKAVIHSYAVDKQVRGTGVGAALIEAACAEVAKAKPIITTHVRVDSPHAVARYEKSGFTRIGHEKHYYSDGCDAYIYEKKLWQ